MAEIDGTGEAAPSAGRGGPRPGGRMTPAALDSGARLIQVVSVVVGVVISVLSFNAARQQEAGAREAEAQARELESRRYAAEVARPFLALRQGYYLEAIKAAGVLANPTDHSGEELNKARKRFRQLYVAELSMVEGREVEGSMRALAAAVDPKLLTLTTEQRAAYNLAHALRDSLVKSWRLDEALVDNPGGVSR